MPLLLAPIYDKCQTLSAKYFSNTVIGTLSNRHVYDWQMMVDTETSSRGNGRNKLRLYRLFNRFYGKEHYCTININSASHQALNYVQRP